MGEIEKLHSIMSKGHYVQFLQDLGVETYEVIWICSGEYVSFLVLTALTLGSQIILQFVSLLAAICTCKVKLDLLNDSRYVKAMVILTFVNLTTANAISVFVQRDQDLLNATVSSGIFAGAVTFLSLTFVPKVSRKIKVKLLCAKTCHSCAYGIAHTAYTQFGGCKC